MEMELHGDAGAILSHLPSDQRRRLDALDASYTELLSRDVADRTDVEALANAVVAFHAEIAKAGIGHENGA